MEITASITETIACPAIGVYGIHSNAYFDDGRCEWCGATQPVAPDYSMMNDREPWEYMFRASLHVLGKLHLLHEAAMSHYAASGSYILSPQHNESLLVHDALLKCCELIREEKNNQWTKR